MINVLKKAIILCIGILFAHIESAQKPANLPEKAANGKAQGLEQAEKAFEFVAQNPNFPDDGVPYWDYNAPNVPNEKRDASAASILASALYELSTYSKTEYYKGWADKIMESLGSSEYRANLGENGNFILMHSVGSIPHNSEVDVPLNYADYYFLEALKRKIDLEK